MSHPIFKNQRFWKFSLNELFNMNSILVQEYAKGSTNVIDLANRIILDIEYPFYLGQPNDSHQRLAFKTYKKCIDYDFWGKADETCALRKGDCEDSSVFFVTCARILGLSAKEVYEVFGVVRDSKTKQILGGHGWAVSKQLNVGQPNMFALMESTLDAPPVEYPVISERFEDLKEPFLFENVIYDPEFLFNDTEYHFVKSIIGGYRIGG